MVKGKIRVFTIKDITDEENGSIKLRCDRDGQMATVRLSPDKVDNAHVKESTMYVQSGDAFLEFICRSVTEAIKLSKWLMGEEMPEGSTMGEAISKAVHPRTCRYCGVSGAEDPRAWVHELECPECVEMRVRIKRVTANAWQLLCNMASAGHLSMVAVEKSWAAAHLHETSSIRLHMEAHDKRLEEVAKAQEEADKRFGQPHHGHETE